MAKPDYTTLAQAFLRLWQDQLHQQMTDPKAIKTMLDAMQKMTGGVHDTPRNPTHASDVGDDAVRLLNARIIKLERQLERLAARLDAMDAKAAKPARSRNKRPAKRVEKNDQNKRRHAAKPARRSKTRKKR